MTDSTIRQSMISAREEYIGIIRDELLGPGSEFSLPDKEHELISSTPTSRYSVGILFPQGNAVNQDNDIVCIMKKWLSSYKGDSEYPGNAIPLYSGTELYIKKEYIEMLEKQFGTLMMKTCVESYTQNY